MSLPHLLVVDAQSLAGRAAHVANGDIDRGVRLWCSMARGAALDVQATHVAAAWDHDGPTFRHALFPAYKHRRTGSMRERIAPIRTGVEATGVVSLSVAEYEGDDSAASLMSRFRSEAHVTLLSNDSDLLQFVSDGVDVASYVGVGNGADGARVRVWTSADVETRFGVAPDMLPALRALCGEEGDDIPGVPRIGKGIAVRLLTRWQTLEQALAATEFVSHRDDTARLAGQRKHIECMLQLTTIRQDVPLPELQLAQCALERVRWPGGGGHTNSVAETGVVHRVAAGPGLDEVPIPEDWYDA